MIIKNISVCKKNKKRVNLFDEDGFAFSCYMDTVFKFDLKKGMQLTEDIMREIVHEDEVKYAVDTALKLLGTRLRSEKEIRRALSQKEISHESIEKAIQNLYDFELLNDEEFADVYAKELSERHGVKMIAQKLVEKGIDRTLANSAAKKYDNIETLKYYYERALKKFNGKTPYDTEQKIIRSLMNKGFNYDDIKRVINGKNEE